MTFRMIYLQPPPGLTKSLNSAIVSVGVEIFLHQWNALGGDIVMPVIVNLRHFEEGNVTLEGELSPKELAGEDFQDELVNITKPLHYDVEVEKNENNLHVRGELDLTLDVFCKRCLKEFEHEVHLAPYHAYIPLEGEDAAPVKNDLVDLLPIFREDMLLAFPQHPLCSEDCAGLANVSASKTLSADKSPPDSGNRSAWSELDKLKL
jgi:uncharacterized metal-binding protein YceD (DUF177 family)